MREEKSMMLEIRAFSPLRACFLGRDAGFGGNEGRIGPCRLDVWQFRPDEDACPPFAAMPDKGAAPFDYDAMQQIKLSAMRYISNCGETLFCAEEGHHMIPLPINVWHCPMPGAYGNQRG